MKKQILTLLSITALSIFGNAQVSTSVQKKTPVLVDVGGMYCTPCGGVAVNLITVEENNPDVVIVSVHADVFAEPETPYDIDVRTENGDEIVATVAYNNSAVANDNIVILNAYPALMWNNGLRSMQALSFLTTKVNTIKSEDAYVNVWTTATINETTRMLDFEVELYYTSDAPGEQFLNTGYTVDSLLGYQSGQPGSITGNFIHNHVLVDYMTPTLGESIGTPIAGTTITREYSVAVPTQFLYDENNIGLDPVINVNHLGSFAHVGTQESVLAGTRTLMNTESGHRNHPTLTNPLPNTNSITENSNTNNMLVYPNPSNGMITVTLNEVVNDNVSIYLFDVTGKIVKQFTKSAADKTINLDFTDVEMGTYILNIESDNQILNKTILIK